jgi:tetratricopeptide (TPR) repeat protein
MLRMAGFFVLVLVSLQFLRHIPIIGVLFRGLFGFWIGAILISWLLTYVSGVLLRRRRLTVRMRELGNVESAHNQGKLGSLMLAHGQARRAVTHLENAAVGEPESAEWHYRLGCALLAAGRPEQAIGPLTRAHDINEEHAYGAVQLRLGEALLKAGKGEAALEAFERFERNHGPSPESCYRRGTTLRALGRKQEAKQTFSRVQDLAAKAATYQRGSNRGWVLRATLAKLG